MRTNVQLSKRKMGFKLFSLMLCLIMGLTLLAGCGGNKDELNADGSATSQQTAVDSGNGASSSEATAKNTVEKASKKIAIVTDFNDDLRKQATEKALAEFEKNGYIEGKNLEVVKFCIEADVKKSTEVLKKAVEAKPDGILLIADYANYSEGAKVITDSGIPCVVYSSIESTGFVDENGKSKGNITGLYAMQKDMYRNAVGSLLNKISPIGDKKAVFITAPVVFTKESIEADFRVLNIPLKEYIVANNFQEYKTAVEKYNNDKEVGWILVGIWPWTNSENSKWTIQDTEKWDFANRKKPAVTLWESAVKEGILCGLGIDIPELGAQSAKMLSRILDGEKVEDVKAEYPVKTNIVLNAKRAKDLKIEIPPDILGAAGEGKVYETDINDPNFK